MRDYAASLGGNEKAAFGLTGEAGSSAEALARAGIKEMSDKFNAMGQQVYVDADKVGAPKRRRRSRKPSASPRTRRW